MQTHTFAEEEAVIVMFQLQQCLLVCYFPPYSDFSFLATLRYCVTATFSPDAWMYGLQFTEADLAASQCCLPQCLMWPGQKTVMN